MSPEEDTLEILTRLNVDVLALKTYTVAGAEHIDAVSAILADVVDDFEKKYLKKEEK